MIYYFHLNECGDATEDEEGSEFADLPAATASAIRDAREIMCAEVKDGKLCLGCCIIIEDGAHQEVSRVWFRDAVAVTGLGGAR